MGAPSPVSLGRSSPAADIHLAFVVFVLRGPNLRARPKRSRLVLLSLGSAPGLPSLSSGLLRACVGPSGDIRPSGWISPLATARSKGNPSLRGFRSGQESRPLVYVVSGRDRTRAAASTVLDAGVVENPNGLSYGLALIDLRLEVLPTFAADDPGWNGREPCSESRNGMALLGSNDYPASCPAMFGYRSLRRCPHSVASVGFPDLLSRSPPL